MNLTIETDKNRTLSNSPLLIGAHTSIQGGLHKALEHGQLIGATTIQLFTRSQRQWHHLPLSQTELKAWHHSLERTTIQYIMSHSSYLINLGSNKPTLLEQSRQAFTQEIQRCLQLNIHYLNFHPGAATGDTAIACLDRIIESLLKLEYLFQTDHPLRLLLETTAGQGSTVGASFEQLAYIIDRVKHHLPIGVCLDTCHIFAAGYDIRTKAQLDHTLLEFQTKIGLEHLYALHINDSLYPLFSKKDRHANLGHGHIGINFFKTMMQHPKLNHLPMYLETPNGHIMWGKEIQMLRSFAKSPKFS